MQFSVKLDRLIPQLPLTSMKYNLQSEHALCSDIFYTVQHVFTLFHKHVK
jgi:hypothetical protein